jgi:hypothetical protein
MRQIPRLLDPNLAWVRQDYFPSTAFYEYLRDLDLALRDMRTTVDGLSTTVAALSVAVGLPSYTVAGVPAAGDHEGALIYVSDEAGGPVPAYSDGTDWLRVDDGTIIS